MKQQTPLRKAIAELKENAKYKHVQHQLAIEQAVEILKDLLPTEQQVIEDAHNKGREDIGVSEFGGSPEYRSGKHYFTSKFEQ
jgi:hypothetical protein